MTSWRRRARMFVPGLLTLTLIACGTSESTTEPGGQPALSGGAAPEPVTTAPTEITITTPLEARPTPGKTFFWLQCELPICEKITTGVKAATKAAGWNYQSLVFKGSDPGGGLESALQRKPDVIGITGIPSAAIEPQLKAAAKAGIPVVTCSPGPEEPAAERFAAICSRTTYPDGENLALWTLKDSGGNTNIVTVTIPSFPSLQTTTDGTNETIAKYCSTCSTDQLNLTVDDLAGGQVAAKLVAYLQSHPEVNYVLFNFADLEIGVPEALRAVGLDERVTLIGNGAGPQQFRAIIDGKRHTAWVAFPALYEGWQIVDAALRLVDGGTLPDGYQDEMDALPTYIVDTAKAAQALAPSFDYEGPAGYQDQFKKLWHLD